jgi:hypothetical protein
MKTIRLKTEDVDALAETFFKAVVFLPKGKWAGKERPVIHKLFPCDIITMACSWYVHFYGVKIDMNMNEERFLARFEAALDREGIHCERADSKTAYNRSQGDYRYKFSSLRLTKIGYELYLELFYESGLEKFSNDDDY